MNLIQLPKNEQWIKADQVIEIRTNDTIVVIKTESFTYHECYETVTEAKKVRDEIAKAVNECSALPLIRVTPIS